MSTEELLGPITIDPAVCHGKPCVRGLRYPVPILLELLSSGMTVGEVLADYAEAFACQRRPLTAAGDPLSP